jgi:hypothetical protein
MNRIEIAVFGPNQGYFIPRLHDCRSLEYTLGYRGTIEVPDHRSETLAVLEHVFIEGNGYGDGPGFTVDRRSLSVGDVVHAAGHGVWMCDAAGWTELTGEEATRFPLGEA